MSTLTKADESTMPTNRAEVEGWLVQQLQRAQKGDESTLPTLRKFLATPGVADIHGNLAALLEKKLVDAAAGKNLLFREAITRKLVLLREELAGPSPTPVERLLAEHAAVCWLRLHDAELRYENGEERSLKMDEFYQRRIDRLHKRYLAAVKTLMLVRKLAVPVLRGGLTYPLIQMKAGTPAAGQIVA